MSHEASAACTHILARLERGQLSAQVALMELLISTESVAQVERLLAGRAPELQELLAANRAACEGIVASLRAQAQLPEASEPDAVLAGVRSLFDTLVSESEEASVAMYSLGNPAILAAATDELVHYLDQQGLLHAETRVVDLGCGIGRMELALAPRVAEVHGYDLSPGMIARAVQRCGDLANVRFSVADGSTLHETRDGACHLLLAIDVFPYAVDAGPAVVSQLFAEAARVLAPGGSFVLCNFSYRDDLPRDRAEVASLAAAYGLTTLALGSQPFTLWNGAVFWLQRS